MVIFYRPINWCELCTVPYVVPTICKFHLDDYKSLSSIDKAILFKMDGFDIIVIFIMLYRFRKQFQEAKKLIWRKSIMIIDKIIWIFKSKFHINYMYLVAKIVNRCRYQIFGSLIRECNKEPPVTLSDEPIQYRVQNPSPWVKYCV